MVFVPLAGERKDAPRPVAATRLGKISTSSPGISEAVFIISPWSYMMPWVLYFGKITKSIPGRPTFMPSIVLAMLCALSRT